MMNKRVKNIIVYCAGLMALYLILDLSNLPSILGIPVDHINWDAMGLICGNVVVVGLAVTTYYLIDKRNKEKSENQRKSALLMLDRTYQDCKRCINEFCLPEIRRAAVNKCSFDKPIFEDNAMMHFLDNPFKYHKQIVDFAYSGVITKEEFSDYIMLRESYRGCASLQLAFFDAPEKFEPLVKEFREIYNQVQGRLQHD